MEKVHDVVVIGGGPGGYVAAIRAAQLGWDAACIEVEQKLGGTCLRVGCIPSKALLESSERFRAAREDLAGHGVDVADVSLNLEAMMARKSGIVEGLSKGINGLFRKNKVTRYSGLGRFVGPATDGVHAVQVVGDDNEQVIGAKNVIIATGSVAAKLGGVEEDGDLIGNSTQALSYPSVPEHLVVIGAGAIGLEMGSVWHRLGARVTVLEYLPRILPGCDGQIAKEAHKIFRKQGLKFQLGVKVTGARREAGGCVVEVEGADPITCDRVLVSVGRWANTTGLNLDAIGLATNSRGQIEVDHDFGTGIEGVYAIGDVIPGPMLAHKAEEDGVACVEKMITGYGHVDYDLVPSIVYTEPEVASVGKTEEALQDAGIGYKVGSFPFMANGRAQAHGHPQGSVKILAHRETDRVLGVHIVGPCAGELIGECAAAMTFGASAEDLARTCHAHPTLSETIKEAALAADARAIHF
ncbi:MAG: dihydrolipoyl dehydrogenase [Myxococcota bacterium]|nr:dihydrolipoyl dehydrogenase [Myxococcota bacterium]